MPGSFRYFWYIFSTICRMTYECCSSCCREIYDFLSACIFGDNRENGHLLAHSTSVIASYEQELCRSILDSFSQIYFHSTRNRLNWDGSNTVIGKTVVLCAKISRLQDDIQATLSNLNTLGKPKIMLVVIHSCESDVIPENLLESIPDDRVTSFTNVIYSDSTSVCYGCPTNRDAAVAINQFIK